MIDVRYCVRYQSWSDLTGPEPSGHTGGKERVACQERHNAAWESAGGEEGPDSTACYICAGGIWSSLGWSPSMSSE